MPHFKKYLRRLSIFTTAAIIFISVCLPLEAQLFSGNSNLFTLKTEFFDIIYPEESLAAAQMLAENADEMYRKTAAFFGVNAALRFPVVITPDTTLLNAYFTVLPYNRIVLYDTLPLQGSLSVFKNTFLSVFGHELTHAITANIKSPFWRAASRIFGDILAPSMALNMVPSFIEGTAVLTESMNGDGRLNAPAVMQVLLQAKLENKFPSWKEASGARDIYPSGDVPYLYGGAFARYLVKKYGSDTFAALWRRAGKVQFALTAGIFKKTYGVSLDKEWAAFVESIPLLSVVSHETVGAKRIDSAGGRYGSVAAAADCLVWIDGASSSIKIKYGDTAAVNLLSYGSLERIDLSADGTLLLLSAAEYDGSLFTSKARVYDIANAAFLTVDLPLRDACFIASDSKIPDIVGVFAVSQAASLIVYRNGEKKILAEFPVGVNVFSPVDCGSGWIACILDEQNTRSVALFNIETGKTVKTAVNLPDGAVFNALSLVSKKNDLIQLAFSWTEDNSLSKSGFITVDFESQNSVTQLSSLTLAGGIQYPIAIDNMLVFTSHFFDHDELYGMKIPVYEEMPSLALTAVVWSSREKNSSKILPNSEKTKPYKPFSYFRKGILVPLAVNALEPSDFLDIGFLGLGLTYFTMDPAEKYSLLGSGGYDFFTQTASFYAQFGSTASPVHWNMETGLTFDHSLYTLLRVGFTASYTKPLRDSVSFWYFEDKIRFVTDFKQWRAVNSFQTYFSNVHKTGSGYYESGGIKLGAGNVFFVNPVETEVYLLFGFTIPFFLPFTNPDGFTLNLPFSANFTAGLQTLGISASVVVFSAEIQRGVPFLPFYIQRVTLEGGYEGMFFWNGLQTVNTASAVAYMTFSPLVGIATSVRINVGIRFLYDFLQKNWRLSFAGAFRL